MRAHLAAIIVLASLSAQARAQPAADVSPIILVHPAVRTTVQLPDEIEQVQVRHGGEMMVKGIGSKLYVRPRWDTPAGLEALLQVKTRTLHRIIILQVVERAEDAAREIVVPGLAAECAQASPEVSPVTPATAEPPAPVPRLEPEPVPAEPEADIQEPTPVPAESKPARPEPATAPDTGHANEAARLSRFELSLHAVGALVGTTEIEVPGYETTLGRKASRAFAIRVVGARRDAPWALEANLGGEWLAAPTLHTKIGDEEFTTEELHVDGPWLRADGGLRMRAGTRLAPRIYGGVGLLVHHRDIEAVTMDGGRRGETMPFLGVLVLGMGLEHRAGNLLLGVDFQVRQGVPAEYRSITWFLSVGYVLDQGD